MFECCFLGAIGVGALTTYDASDILSCLYPTVSDQPKRDKSFDRLPAPAVEERLSSVDPFEAVSFEERVK